MSENSIKIVGMFKQDAERVSKERPEAEQEKEAVASILL